MHEELRNYINTVTATSIADEEFARVCQAFTSRLVKKKQFILHEGTVCKYMTFIVKGAMRQYTVDIRGVEHIVRFGIEGWWISDRESFTKSIPSKYSIDALEDCELLTITKADLDAMLALSPTFCKLTHILDENHFIAAQKRIEASISYSAEERYRYLADTYPEFIKRFPQNMIASYLGMTAETISRLKKHMHP